MFPKSLPVFAFFALCNVIWSETSTELIAEDEPLLERVLRLEVKMDLAEQEIDLVKDVMADHVAAIKSVLEPLNQMVGTISDDFEKLKTSGVNITNEGTRGAQQIAFSAYRPSAITLSPGQIIVFQSVLLNEGNGYSPSTGVFTAPVAGLYLITVHVCNEGGRTVAYSIEHNGTGLAYRIQHQPSGESCSSANILRRVTVGDTIRVKTTFQTQFREDKYRRATFMGVLLN